MNTAIDKVQALPILVLVVAALVLGSGVWCFVRVDQQVLVGGVMIGIAISLFVAAGILMRSRQLIMRKPTR